MQCLKTEHEMLFKALLGKTGKFFVSPCRRGVHSILGVTFANVTLEEANITFPFFKVMFSNTQESSASPVPLAGWRILGVFQISSF